MTKPAKLFKFSTLLIVLVVGCYSGGGKPIDKDTGIILGIIKSMGLTAQTVSYQDGDDGNENDIDVALIGRIVEDNNDSDGAQKGDFVFGYSMYFEDHAVIDSGQSVLYLDTDRNINTGKIISDKNNSEIGADVLLVDHHPDKLTNAYYLWDPVDGVWMPLMFGDYISISESTIQNSKYYTSVVVDGTEQLLASEPAIGIVMFQEFLDSVPSDSVITYDKTQQFEFPVIEEVPVFGGPSLPPPPPQAPPMPVEPGPVIQ